MIWRCWSARGRRPSQGAKPRDRVGQHADILFDRRASAEHEPDDEYGGEDGESGVGHTQYYAVGLMFSQES